VQHYYPLTWEAYTNAERARAIQFYKDHPDMKFDLTEHKDG
jgi:hypothetical protein